MHGIVFWWKFNPYKPQSAQQTKARKEKNKLRKNETSTWVEVYCDKSWLPVVSDEGEFEIQKVEEVEKSMKWPMTYAVAFDKERFRKLIFIMTSLLKCDVIHWYSPYNASF